MKENSAQSTSVTSAAFITVVGSPKLNLEYQITETTFLLRPVGVIDEESKFDELLDVIAAMELKPSVAVIDLGSITRINSCGVREWVLFIAMLTTQLPILFKNIGELMMEQSSVINGVFGKPGANVQSVQLPFFCPQCSTRSFFLAQMPDLKISGKSVQIPELKCKDCSAKLEFDAPLEQYFGYFLR